MRRLFVAVLLVVGLPLSMGGQELRLPNKTDSVKFAVIGDSGQPGKGQDAIARQMVNWRTKFPFEFVLMTGDNLYGAEKPKDYEKKFSIPYKPLIDSGRSEEHTSELQSQSNLVCRLLLEKKKKKKKQHLLSN